MASMNRRTLIRSAAGALAALVAPGAMARGLVSRAAARAGRAGPARDPRFRISLAEWSLHRALRAGEMTNLDFPGRAAGEFGIDAVEYVNAFFKDKAEDAAYLAALNARCADAGVRSLLIMCDGEGDLGDADDARRARAVDNHRRWVHAARTLGCHSIRVNAASSGSWEEQRERAADGLRRLTEFADTLGINVIVENHGGLSSNGRWLSETIRAVDHPRCGTLPDFGNFCLDWSRADDPAAWYDRYQGVAELMPFAKAVSAKSHEFDESGNEVRTDYARMMKIVLDAGYRGYVGIEYEGDRHSEPEGIRMTKALLERVRESMREPEAGTEHAG